MVYAESSKEGKQMIKGNGKKEYIYKLRKNKRTCLEEMQRSQKQRSQKANYNM